MISILNFFFYYEIKKMNYMKDLEEKIFILKIQQMYFQSLKKHSKKI